MSLQQRLNLRTGRKIVLQAISSEYLTRTHHHPQIGLSWTRSTFLQRLPLVPIRGIWAADFMFWAMNSNLCTKTTFTGNDVAVYCMSAPQLQHITMMTIAWTDDQYVQGLQDSTLKDMAVYCMRKHQQSKTPSVNSPLAMLPKPTAVSTDAGSTAPKDKKTKHGQRDTEVRGSESRVASSDAGSTAPKNKKTKHGQRDTEVRGSESMVASSDAGSTALASKVRVVDLTTSFGISFDASALWFIVHIMQPGWDEDTRAKIMGLPVTTTDIDALAVHPAGPLALDLVLSATPSPSHNTQRVAKVQTDCQLSPRSGSTAYECKSHTSPGLGIVHGYIHNHLGEPD